MQPYPAATIQRWSTRNVSENRRLDYYDEALTAAIDPMGVARRVAAPFDAEIAAATLGPISVIHGVGSSHDCLRSHRDLARSTGRNFHLILNLGSTWGLTHRGRTRLRPGEAVLLDSRYRHYMEFLSPFDVVHLKLPDTWLQAWVSSPDVLVGKAIASASGWGRALTTFVAGLSPEFVLSAPLPGTVIADQVGALLALVASERASTPVAPTRGESDLRDRIRELVVQRCTESALGPNEVAHALGVSTRTLHRSLAACGETFGAALMAARTELAVRMLESPLFRRLTTAAIGRRAGFSDPSHFVRVLRRRLGRTPSQIRRGVAFAVPEDTPESSRAVPCAARPRGP